jgi:mannose-1-phosphate guanylyltransferase
MTMNHESGRIRPVILAGGAGTRLWPMSTPAKPKHLLPLIGDSSLFEQTLAATASARRSSSPTMPRPTS